MAKKIVMDQGLTLRLCGGVCPQHHLFAAAESHGCLARNFGMIWMGKASHNYYTLGLELTESLENR